jgi:hypothetical protein
VPQVGGKNRMRQMQRSQPNQSIQTLLPPSA